MRQANFLFPSDRSVQERKLACRTLYYSANAAGHQPQNLSSCSNEQAISVTLYRSKASKIDFIGLESFA
jgi:hypothetical protein